MTNADTGTPGSAITGLACGSCTRAYPDTEPILTCRACGNPLDAIYDYHAIRERFSLDRVLRRPPSVWRWHEFLPVRDLRHVVDLGAGSTPLLHAERLGGVLGLRRLYLKRDDIGPTSSLKDRSFAVAVSKAVELGVRQAFTYSSGNAAASLAAHAAKAGIEVVLLVNEQASAQKLAMIATYGHPILRLRWTMFQEVTELLRFAHEELGLYHFVNFANPFRHEGQKTYGYEVWWELEQRVPDWMVHPTGTGGGVYGAWRGFTELRTVGLTNRVPKMLVVEPEACAPAVVAYERGAHGASPHGDVHATICDSIACNDLPYGGRRVLTAVYESGGAAVSVSDEETTEAARLLTQEGIFAEPSAATGVAAVRKLVVAGTIDPEEVVVCVITGSGLKHLDVTGLHALERVPVIPTTATAFREALAVLRRSSSGRAPGLAVGAEVTTGA